MCIHFINSGLTLLEVLICLLLLSLGTLSVIDLQTINFRNLTSSYYFTVASNQARNAAELLAICNMDAACISMSQQQWQRDNKLLLPNATSAWTKNDGVTEISLSWDRKKQKNKSTQKLLISSFY